VIQFLASTTGRIIRIVAGMALILIGIFLVKDVGGLVIAVVGLVPLAAGLLDFCVFAPLFGEPFSGKAIREH
jgi:hypothetical protein